MIEFLDVLTSFWAKWLVAPSFFLGIIGIFVYFYSSSNEDRIKKIPKAIGIFLIGLLVFTWLTFYTLAWTLETLVKNELIAFLNQPDLEIEINSEKVDTDYSYRVINELKRIGDLPTTKSHSTKELQIDIISKKESSTIRIQQDSKMMYQFWIYSDDYNYTKDHYIGKLKTSVFIKYYGNKLHP